MMRRRSYVALGETEMELLQHVWDLERATVADVHERVLETRQTAYTTVMTVMKRLVEKGYLQYEKVGMAHVYSAAKPAEQVRTNLLKSIVAQAFRGSPLALMQNLVKQGTLSAAEIEELKTLIEHMGSNQGEKQQ